MTRCWEAGWLTGTGQTTKDRRMRMWVRVIADASQSMGAIRGQKAGMRCRAKIAKQMDVDNKVGEIMPRADSYRRASRQASKQASTNANQGTEPAQQERWAPYRTAQQKHDVV